MKRVCLSAGIVLLAFLATVTVGNHPAAGVDKPPVVEWKAVPYGSSGGVLPGAPIPIALLTFTAPEAGFVWLNSTGFCSFAPPSNPLSGSGGTPALVIGWRGVGATVLSPSSGDATFNNIPATIGVLESLPYSASAVFPVLGGTQTFDLDLQIGTVFSSVISCSGVNVVMFTNTQLL